MGCKKDTFLKVGRPSMVELERFDLKSGLCDGDTLGQATAFAKGGTPPYQFLWSNGKTSATATGLKSGFVTVTITDFFNCSAIATSQLKSLGNLEAKLTATPISCHDGTNGSIVIEPYNGTKPYQSSLDGFTFGPKFKYVGLKPGKYAVFVKDANGCTWVGDTTLQNPIVMQLTAGPDIELVYGDSVQLKAVATNQKGKVTYEWFQPYKSTLSCLNCDRPWAKTLYDIVYQVIATDSLGCEAESEVRLKILKKAGVDVPTGFTPNGDGNNDLLLVHGVAGTKVLSFRIYDSWGEQLYEDNNFSVNDQSRGWDGNFRSNAVQSGVYVWYLTVENRDGTKKAYKGNVTLIR
jgi:gliding motility-associated-like protein